MHNAVTIFNYFLTYNIRFILRYFIPTPTVITLIEKQFYYFCWLFVKEQACWSNTQRSWRGMKHTFATQHLPQTSLLELTLSTCNFFTNTLILQTTLIITILLYSTCILWKVYNSIDMVMISVAKLSLNAIRWDTKDKYIYQSIKLCSYFSPLSKQYIHHSTRKQNK